MTAGSNSAATDVSCQVCDLKDLW